MSAEDIDQIMNRLLRERFNPQLSYATRVAESLDKNTCEIDVKFREVLMKIFLSPLSEEETLQLTRSMVRIFDELGIDFLGDRHGV